MYFTKFPPVIAASIALVSASPVQPRLEQSPLSDPNYGPLPGQSDIYNTYKGRDPPFPANITTPIPPAASGPPGVDDVLFQNLLSAEWIIYSFYQTGVLTFNTSSFTEAGFPNTTYERIMGMRNNEAGHLRIFQDNISPTSYKPGPCKYTFPFKGVKDYLAIQLLIEVSSMAFLTGLVQQTETNAIKGALTAVGEVETRHETWALVDIWGIDPFSGPADTSYPYPNHVMDLTKRFIVPGSCPEINPEYPNPSQNLPTLELNSTASPGHPGDDIVFEFPDKTNQPHFNPEQQYWAVFVHGLTNISVPFDTCNNSSKVPEFDADRGIIITIIADAPGAPTKETIVAGPIILVQQPGILTGVF